MSCRSPSLPHWHWKLSREFIERYRHLFPEEQVCALSHLFANTQQLMLGEADQVRRLVLDLVRDDLPVKAEPVPKVEVKREMDCGESWDKKLPGLEPITAKGAFKTEPEVVVEKVVPITQGRTINPDILDSNCDVNPMVKMNKKTLKKAEKQAKFKAKSVESLRKHKEIYRSLVIFDNDFSKTAQEFNKLGLGRIVSINHREFDNVHRRSVVAVKIGAKTFPLVEAWGKTAKMARKSAMAAFLKEMKKICCQIVSKKPSCRLKNQVTRREDPAANIEYYRTMIADFAKQSVKQDLTFGKGFSPEERRQFKKIARKLKLQTCYDGPHRLKILGRTTPARTIVERIVVQKDPELCELYEVIQPSGAARWKVARKFPL
ncbi:uncharacterized protein LOC120432003 isoform X2 [Culex pipiens pallens]|uniref:uncharacterized protein LOC120432003 isoform X2 n=1 Tax=Culex pipiens pallens TaxID=42434 RepID=UPI0019542D25|nr:uncharacterized protein LOC120432003 isoform X2 [Culex pipiens pallens]